MQNQRTRWHRAFLAFVIYNEKVNKNKPKTILIVDSEKLLLNTLGVQLRQEGFEVVQAEDGQTAWDKMVSEKPQVVVLELVLLKKNGFELLKEIHAGFPKIPVLVFSKLSGEEDIKKARALGVREYFTKKDATVKNVIDKLKNL